MTVTDRPEQMDLGARLALAQAEVPPLRDRVGELEAALAAALEEARYGDAENIKADLDQARQAFHIAEATARILAETQQTIDASRIAEERKLVEHQRHEEMQRQIEAMQASEAEHLDEMNRELATARAGVEAVRESLQRALSHQNAAGAVRVEIAGLQADLEGVQRSQFVAKPNNVSALLEGGDLVLRTIFLGRRP